VDSETLGIWGLVALAAFWLVVLPYFLTVGILHKLGYHALCRLKCDASLASENVRVQLREEYKKGLRQGMRAAATFGTDESRKMVAEHSSLPEWKRKENDDEFTAAVKEKYDQIRFAFDVTDELNVSVTALAVALGTTSATAEDPGRALTVACGVAAEYAGVPDPTTAKIAAQSETQ